MKPSYEERLSMAKAICEMPIKGNMPGQKFPRGVRVKVDKKMPSFMFHFPSDFEGIIEHTYAQKFWGDDVKSYCLTVLKDGKPINSIAWYYESQLTLISDDIQAGLKIIEEYNKGELK